MFKMRKTISSKYCQLDKIVNYIKLRKGNVEIVVQQRPLKITILIIIVIIQQKNLVPAQFFDCRFRVFFLFFISQGIASND